MKQLLAQSRTEQIAAREKEQRQQQIETDALLNRWRVENEAAMETEKQKQIRAREATIKIKTQQYEDGKALAAKRAEEKLIEIEQARFLNSIDNQDDKRFVELCKAEIARNVSLGKPIYTLLRALQFEQPQLLASKTVKVKRTKEES
ncbi:hypothetical protein EON65_42880 [archaeon]|nr:MAG: hypothetical protein EON65_42880 [archaeon]